MKTTYSWLKDYVDIKLKPEELSHKLTMAGLEVTSLKKIGSDWLFEVEVTTNRPDWLSVIGIAREVAAITDKRLRLPAFSLQPSAFSDPSVELIDKRGCPRYTARVIEGVKVGPSPKWLAQRLESVGLRPVNNVVDITNFCLLEYGQPLHAFDFDKLAGGKIVIRKAKSGEKMTTIDGDKRALDADMLIIADEKWPVAIAGVMGGLDTEVTAATKTVLLESAYFDPATVRRQSKKLGLSSESSYRFERRVDLETVPVCSDRATALIADIAGAKEISSLVDKGAKKVSTKTVSIDCNRINKFLGTDIPAAKMKSILTSLGLKPRGKSSFAIPSFRQDLYREVDLIEEIARIWSYDKVPFRRMQVAASADEAMPFDMDMTNKARQLLVSFGLNEVITYSLTSAENTSLLEGKRNEAIVLSNPLSPELSCLRTSLMPGVAQAIRFNVNRKNIDLKLFEIGPVYSAKARGTCEQKRIAIALCGNRICDWQQKKIPADTHYLKGIVESLLDEMGVSNISVEPKQTPILDNAQSAVIKVGKEEIGFLGKAGIELQAKLDIDCDVFLAEINFSSLLKKIAPSKKFQSIPKFPGVARDISLFVGEDTPARKITSTIKEVGGKLIEDIDTFDYYKGKQVPKGQKSLLYSVKYQAPDRTLTNEEVDALHAKICDTLKTHLNAQIRTT